VSDYWDHLARPGPEAVVVDGVELRRRSRVRLRPRAGGDVMDFALTGRTAVIDGIEEDTEGNVQLAITVEEDPGQDLGEQRRPGHRFFFGLDEVEPLGAEPPAAPSTRILVAGIGNVFLGDDGFGVEVAGRLARAALPAGVHVEDFGIRGMDLAYALQDYDVAVFVDTVHRGEPPGTLYVIEAELDEESVGLDAHGMDPVKVLALARELGGPLPRVLVVGCEPATVGGIDEELVAELSEPVRAAVDRAVGLVESLVADLSEGREVERA
jgi:hydrogenase maturation protease